MKNVQRLTKFTTFKQLMRWGLAATTLMFMAGCQTPPASVSEASSPAAESSPAATQPQEKTTVRFTLSWLLQGVDAPLTLAIERGYFTEEGIEVQFERGFGSADTASKIAADQYDMGFGDMYSMIEFNQRNPDQKLVAVAVPYNKAPFAIVTLKSSGIDTPQELEGKTLGAPAGDAPRRLWPVFAQEVGVNPDSVEWVTMEPKLRESFLLQGQVDGISGFIYSMLPSLIKGGQSIDDLNIFYYIDNGLNYYGNVVLVQESYLKENPEAVRAFLRAYLRGIQDVLKDPEAGLASVVAAGDELMNEDAERLRLQLALDGLIINEEVERLGLGAVDPARLQESIEQTVAGFELQKTPRIEEVFNDEFLPPLEARQAPPATEQKPLN
jgi:NitT/TauT family transport system substrate-binding protein